MPNLSTQRPWRMRRLAYLALAALAALSLVAAACGDDDDDDDATATATEAATEPTDEATDEPTDEATEEPTDEAANPVVLEISATDIAYDTDTLAVAADAPFTVQFTSNDSVPHSFSFEVDGEVLSTGIETGPTTLTLDVDGLAAGDYTYVCEIHPSMSGTLTAS